MNQYLRIKDVPKEFPAFTENSIRWLIYKKEQNGFKQVLRRAGKRILIDRDSFVAWIESSKLAP